MNHSGQHYFDLPVSLSDSSPSKCVLLHHKMSDLTSLSDKERKRPFVVCSQSLRNLKSIITENVISNNSFEKPNEYIFSTDHSDEIEKKKRKESPSFPNRNVLIEYLTKPDLKNLSSRRTVTLKEHCEEQDFEQSDIKNTTENIQCSPKRIVIAQITDGVQNKAMNDTRVISQPNRGVVAFNDSRTDHNSSQPINSNEKEPTIIPHLPSFSSMYLFDSSLSSCNLKPIHSSSAHINQEYVTPVRQFITSQNNHENELKPIRNIDSTSPNLSNLTDNDDINHPESNSSTTFSNRMISIVSSTDNSSVDQSYSFASTPYPQFESVRTPTQESHSFIPSALLDCCDSNPRQQSTSNENKLEHWDSFHTPVILRETMINISKRLIKNEPLPIVDTHCHFDLIFDRLYIKHNNLTKYFDDYKDLYPSGLSFELAIQVFWRPRHLTEKNWINWYSKYLNDERVYGSCGIHPHWSSAWRESSIEDIERCLKHPKVVAIGEIGLDFGPKNTCNVEQQYRVFEEQLKIAVKWSKLIVIHSRNAYEQTFNIMKQVLEPNHKIHLHCFVGTIDIVHLFTSYFTEIKFGFTPIISRGNFLHTVIQQLDLTQILSETDSPYFVPEELFNLSRCAHPGMVYSVIEIVAQIQRLSIDDVAYQLRENARQIYGV